MTLREFLPLFKSQSKIKTFHLTSGRMIPVGDHDRIAFQETDPLICIISEELSFETAFSLTSVESVVLVNSRRR